MVWVQTVWVQMVWVYHPPVNSEVSGWVSGLTCFPLPLTACKTSDRPYLRGATAGDSRIIATAPGAPTVEVDSHDDDYDDYDDDPRMVRVGPRVGFRAATILQGVGVVAGGRGWKVSGKGCCWQVTGKGDCWKVNMVWVWVLSRVI